MGKAELAAEPSMEDLLASIRKAINEDAGLPANDPPAKSASAPPAQTRGFRARLEETTANRQAAQDARQGEILELRNKVAGQLGRNTGFEREIPPPRTYEPQRREVPARTPGFAGLLGGGENQQARAFTGGDPARELRPSISEDYQEHRRYEPEPPVRMWQPEPDSPRYLPPPQPAYRPDYGHTDVVMSPGPSAQANAAFNQLAETLMARAIGDRSIEQMTQDLLRGMLRQWLDDNLPPLVERLVREEIERVARRGPMR